jgi:mannose-6-phosphate isomerase-like protein (cupin superfamily)
MKRRVRYLGLGLGLAGLALSSCAKPPVAVFDAFLPEGRRTEPLSALVDQPLEPDQYVRFTDIGRDEHSSHHLIWVRIGGVLHRHDHHDLNAVLLRGFGRLQLGDEEREVGPGSIIYAPRGVPHVFSNRSNEPAVAYFVFTPPYDGADRVLIDAVE